MGVSKIFSDISGLVTEFQSQFENEAGSNLRSWHHGPPHWTYQQVFVRKPGSDSAQLSTEPTWMVSCLSLKEQNNTPTLMLFFLRSFQDDVRPLFLSVSQKYLHLMSNWHIKTEISSFLCLGVDEVFAIPATVVNNHYEDIYFVTSNRYWVMQVPRYRMPQPSVRYGVRLHFWYAQHRSDFPRIRLSYVLSYFLIRAIYHMRHKGYYVTSKKWLLRACKEFCQNSKC